MMDDPLPDYEEDPLDDRERFCWRCGGDGIGVEGDDWDCDDPLWIAEGTIVKCNCCGGSGKAEDCTYW